MAQRVLITGASDGIGLELAIYYASENCLVIGVGSRPEEDLPEKWPTGARYIQAELSQPDAVETILNAVRDSGWSHLDIAILNAGFGKVIHPSDETAENIARTIDINLTSAVLLTQQLHPLLAATQDKSCLVLIGSVARMGTPQFASYAASKGGLHGLGRSLRQEWRGSIDVITIHPGPTATGMHEKAGLTAGFAQRFFIDSQYMAKKIRQTIRRRTAVKTISFGQRAIDFLLTPLGLAPN